MLRSFAALLLALTLAACESGGPKFSNVDITGAEYARGFELTDHNGKQRTLADFRGKVVLLFFGFTRCPDVCPTTLVELKQVLQKLGPDADRVQVLFVTLDPERDTAAVLSQYVPAFDKRFLGLYGDPAATLKTAKEFKVYFEKRAGATPEAYSIDHTTASYVFDPSGKVRLYVKHDRIGTLVEDVRTLLKG